MNKKPRVLLTGASGSIGSDVAQRLSGLTEQYELTFFDLDKRSVRRKLDRYRGQAELIYGDIRNRSDVERACRDQQIVLHLAALIPPMADDDWQVTRETNAGGTKNLIECLEEHSPGCYFVYTSSIAVYGDRLDDYWISVDDDLKSAPDDIYAQTKIAAEQYVRNSNLSWSILRLTAIMGNHKPSGLMFKQPLATKMEIATIRDTGRALVHSLNHLEELEYKTFNLGGGETCRVQYDDFLSRSFKVLGLGKADFPDKAFAEKDFHCGYFSDSDELEAIIHFRTDTLDDYLQLEADKINPVVRLIIPLIRKLVKFRLLLLSKPYKAWKKGNEQEIQRYFNV